MVFVLPSAYVWLTFGLQPIYVAQKYKYHFLTILGLGLFSLSGEEGYKITILLSRKGLATLDLLKEMSGFGSRGRTMEEAILTIWELADINETFLKEYVNMAKSGRTFDANTFFPYIVSIQTKLSRFGSPAAFKKKT